MGQIERGDARDQHCAKGGCEQKLEGLGVQEEHWNGSWVVVIGRRSIYQREESRLAVRNRIMMPL